MSSRAEILALRRQLLVARSRLQRLKIGVQADALRENLRWPRAALALAGSSPARSVMLGLLLLAAGRGRLARRVAVAAAVLAWLRRAPADPATRVEKIS